MMVIPNPGGWEMNCPQCDARVRVQFFGANGTEEDIAECGECGSIWRRVLNGWTLDGSLHPWSSPLRNEWPERSSSSTSTNGIYMISAYQALRSLPCTAIHYSMRIAHTIEECTN